MKEGTNTAYAEAIGAIVHHVVGNLEDDEEIDKVMDMVFTMIFTNLNQPSRLTQAAAANCLTKVIQDTPIQPLLLTLPTVCRSILDTMAGAGFKAYMQILESLISLILSVEHEFAPYGQEFLPVLLQCVESSDWNSRKMAIDCMYTLAAILEESIIPFKKDIL